MYCFKIVKVLEIWRNSSGISIWDATNCLATKSVPGDSNWLAARGFRKRHVIEKWYPSSSNGSTVYWTITSPSLRLHLVRFLASVSQHLMFIISRASFWTLSRHRVLGLSLLPVPIICSLNNCLRICSSFILSTCLACLCILTWSTSFLSLYNWYSSWFYLMRHHSSSFTDWYIFLSTFFPRIAALNKKWRNR